MILLFFFHAASFLHYTFLAAVIMMPFHRGINKGPTFNINLVNGRKQNAIKGGKLTFVFHSRVAQTQISVKNSADVKHVTNLLQNVQFY